MPFTLPSKREEYRRCKTDYTYFPHKCNIMSSEYHLFVGIKEKSEEQLSPPPTHTIQ